LKGPPLEYRIAGPVRMNSPARLFISRDVATTRPEDDPNFGDCYTFVAIMQLKGTESSWGLLENGNTLLSIHCQ